MVSRSARLVWLIVAVTLVACGPGRQGPWTTVGGDRVDDGLLLSMPGPSGHCDWESAEFLFIGRDGAVPGIPVERNDQYIRDPERLFRSHLAAAFDADAELPADAAATGYARAGIELWLAPSDPTSVYIRSNDRFERWPRVREDHPILCA
jgi:hypothetical protein